MPYAKSRSGPRDGIARRFARYLEISRRSLNELCDCRRSAQRKGYIASKEAADAHRLTRRLYPALNNFIAYLKRNPTGRRRCRSATGRQ